MARPSCFGTFFPTINLLSLVLVMASVQSSCCIYGGITSVLITSSTHSYNVCCKSLLMLLAKWTIFELGIRFSRVHPIFRYGPWCWSARFGNKWIIMAVSL